ncbi:MAG: CotH kinase family protein [Ignavibacteria bacterium]|nr:CotH kinase family protein [Ignavibacteria bacterium]MBI3765366.1 CotH kinase family protein [Ignavibacteriales bacterium]
MHDRLSDRASLRQITRGNNLPDVMSRLIVQSLFFRTTNVLRNPITLLLWGIFIITTADGQLPQFTITMSDDDYRALNARDIFVDEFLPATVEYQGTTWNKAEIRFKGRSTRYFPKKSYRLKFPKNKLFQNTHQINLHAMYTDKSSIREKLAWDLFQDMGEMAPHAWFARLSINQQYKGLYLVVDRIDRYFLQHRERFAWSLYNSGGFYSLADLTPQSVDLLKLYYEKEIGDDNDYSDLQGLINVLNFTPDSTFPAALDSLFEVNSIYNWLAGNILMMMGDSYNKNYFLYHDVSRKTQSWVIIPWDYDESFGLSGDVAVPYPHSLLNDGFAYTFPPLSGPPNVVKDRVWNIPSLQQHLRRYVDTLLHSVFTEEHLFPRIDSLSALIRDDVAADSQKWGSDQDFLDNVETVKYFITARRNYLLKTFIGSPTGDFCSVTLPIKRGSNPYHFVEMEGRLLATLWVKDAGNLDSLRVEAFPDSIPREIDPVDTGKCVRRWIRVTAIPENAHFTATFQWMYQDVSSLDREVGTQVKDERALRGYAYNGRSWTGLRSRVNPYANIVTIDSFTQDMCGDSTYIALIVR